MTPVMDWSAAEIARKVRSGEISAAEMLAASLERIRLTDGISGQVGLTQWDEAEERKVHAFIQISKDLAEAQAAAVDAKAARGEDPGLLAGVPVAIKDIFCVEGTHTTAGSRMLANFRPPYTATPVQRLIDAGALVVGKANMDEFAYGSSSESSAFQPSPNNPWDPTRVPGGSSGGSAASVASTEVALSLGSDTGGSIRQPSSFCGVVGMKPTYGRVSRYGMIAFASSLDCPGPLARTVSDAALMLQVIAGEDPRDSTTSQQPVPDYQLALQQDVHGLRIGLSPDYDRIVFPDVETGEIGTEPIQAEVSRAVYDAAEQLARQGAEIVEDVPMPNARHGIPTYFVISRVEASSNLHRFDGVKYGYRTAQPVSDLNELYRLSRAEGFGTEPKLRILMGMYVSSAAYSHQYYLRARKVRAMIRRDFDTAFDPAGAYRLDALLTPTTPTTAFKRKAVYGNSVLMQYADQMTVSANHAGLPALSFPGGLDGQGLPIGLQLIAGDFREDLLLRIAHAYELATRQAAWRSAVPEAVRNEASK